MVLTGKVKMGILTAQARMVFAPAVENGNLSVTVVSAKFGSVPVPDSALDQITKSVNQNLTQYISVEGRSVQIDEVVIANGTMTITGKAR
jgi:uncharacterized protein YpmS